MGHADFLNQKVVQATLSGHEAALGRWFARALDADGDATILGVAAPPPGSGFSAENYFVDVAWRAEEGARRARFVLRRVSAGRQMFPGRNFTHERQVQELITKLGAAPAPRILGYEDDKAVLGERFYVMHCLEGDVPPTSPSHHEAGMLMEMSPEARRSLWLGALEDLGQLHRRTRGLAEIEVFAQDRDGRSAFSHALDYWRDHYALAAEDQPLDLMRRVEAWLRAHEPGEQNRALCWGDSRLGNAMFDASGRCVGMFDWELFGVGDPVRDLAYWLYTDDHFAFASGKRLADWPTHEESIAAYEEGAGYAVDRANLDFYRVYQGYHIISTLTRLIQLKKEAGQLPADLVIGAHFTPVAYLQAEWDRVRRDQSDWPPST